MDRFVPLICAAILFAAWQVGTVLLRAIGEGDRHVATGLPAGISLFVFALWLYFVTGLLDHFGASIWFGIAVLLAFGACLGVVVAVVVAVGRSFVRRAG